MERNEANRKDYGADEGWGCVAEYRNTIQRGLRQDISTVKLTRDEQPK